MSKSYLKIFLIYIGIIYFQVKLSFVLEVNGYIPDLLLLSIIYSGLINKNPMFSIISAFFTGLIIDMLIGDVIGLSSLVYVFAGFFASVISREVGKLTKSLIFLIFLVIIFIVEIIQYNILFFGDNFFKILIYTVLPLVLYNIIIQLFVTYIYPFSFKRK